MASLSVNSVRTESVHFTMARRLFWLVYGASLLTQYVGRAWDTYWHTTHTFDGFFSPPHVFIYVMTTLISALLMIVVFISEVRVWFGAGALSLVIGSYGLQAVGGLLLDNIWHSRFGLDETLWSLPHALIGWARLVGLFGFMACAVALHRHRPFFPQVTLLFGFFVMGATGTTLLGPLYVNHTPATIRAIMQMPILSAQPEFLHAYQIYLDRGLDRTNPFMAVFGALWAGVVIGFLHKLDRRAHVLLTVAIAWTAITALGDQMAVLNLNTYFPTQNDARAWLPLPILPAVIGWLLLRASHWRWLSAGWLFGVCIFLFWGLNPLTGLLVISSGPALAGGAWIGAQVFSIIDRPTRNGSLALLIGVGVFIPTGLGLIDLVFRR